jgi:hypothetical protein
MPKGCGGKADRMTEPPAAPPPEGETARSTAFAPPPPDPPGAPAPSASPASAPPPGFAVPARNSGRAIASLVLGVCATSFALFFFWLYGFGSLVGVVCGILGVVFGRRARREIDASPATVEGRGLATAGIVTGWIGLVAGVIGFVGIGLFVWWLTTTEGW